MPRPMNAETKRVMDYLIHHLSLYGNTVLNKRMDIKKYVKMLEARGYDVTYRKCHDRPDLDEDMHRQMNDWCYILELKDRTVHYEFKSEG